MPVSVLIVDDEPTFRGHAGELVELSGLHVAGEAADGPEALRLARQLRPAAVLLDVNLPGDDGLSVARSLARLPEPPRVLLVSADADVADEEVRACGAVAFIPKEELPVSDLHALLAAPAGDA
ncbi:MAG TPA: response regulator transcription factor [Solirubrobacteraceae bacterium]|nr:response regulator transcription factor [Solirubrobacteraceae bacterium]